MYTTEVPLFSFDLFEFLPYLNEGVSRKIAVSHLPWAELEISLGTGMPAAFAIREPSGRRNRIIDRYFSGQQSDQPFLFP